MRSLSINYNGGNINIEVKEFNQHVSLSRNPKVHGNSCIVNNTCWHEDMEQTIKPREYNYYAMSNNEFVNTEELSTSTNYNNNTLLIQSISVSLTITQTTLEKLNCEKLVIAQKQRSRGQLLKSENTNVLQTQLNVKDNLALEVQYLINI